MNSYLVRKDLGRSSKGYVASRNVLSVFPLPINANQCPFNKPEFLQNMLDVFNVITTYPYLPTNAVFKTEMQHTLLNKCNFPLEQCILFLQEYPYKIGSIPSKETPYQSPLGECSVHFKISIEQYPFSKSKDLYIYIYICTICIRSINDIEHPSQKCNMLETASIIKECSFASYNRILLKKQHLEN